jgi:ribonucleoside-diphosphate reductase beta chain
MYREVQTIYDKDEYTMEHTDEILNPDFDTKTTNGIQRFLENLIGFYVITEGIFFYSGFVMMLSFGRQNRMPGTCEQIQYILRDESVHMNFGIELINTVVDENPAAWTEEFKTAVIERVKKAVELEVAYAKDCLPSGILGLNFFETRVTEYQTGGALEWE